MHDKVVRRRRAVLGLLVFISLVLLTAYFGESTSSPLHSVQRGIVAVVSPIQDGASKALSPVRDVSDWVSTTLRAKTQNAQLRRDDQSLTSQLAVAKQQAINEPELARELKLDENIGVAADNPVSASVIVRDPSVFYQQVLVNRGSSSGVRLGDAVIADGALVGTISELTGQASAEVQLITNHTVEVAAEVQDPQGDTGVLQPVLGNNLELQDLPRQAPIHQGELVVTAGFRNPTDLSQSGSLYPAAIPIGTVAAFDSNELQNNGEVPVTPLASIRRFTSVQILTKTVSGTEEADVR